MYRLNPFAVSVLNPFANVHGNLRLDSSREQLHTLRNMDLAARKCHAVKVAELVKFFLSGDADLQMVSSMSLQAISRSL